MGKAVLISIKPKWCELIASGKKTIEIRKTKPKIATPFKCYIYCTQRTDHPRGWLGCYDHDTRRFGLISPLNIEVVSGKVIGEFICDKVHRYAIYGTNQYDKRYCEVDPSLYIHPIDYKPMCLLKEEFISYGNGIELFGWHISDLTIYDEPKELYKFNGICSKKALTDCECGSCKRLLETGIGHCPLDWIKKAPQSWQYVEELTSV